MGWHELKTLAGSVFAALSDGRSPNAEWSAFRNAAQATDGAPPFHLRTLIHELRKVQGQRSRADVTILDHGCGSGYTLLYLAALGWTNIYGVDVGGPAERLNPLMNDLLGVSGKRFQIYEGATLPLPDESIDLVFSQQVLEHVNPNLYQRYLQEEARVLKAGGRAYHQIPQRLTPYESHTRTWFLHYLPLPAFRSAANAISRGNDVSSRVLFLRWPWLIRADFRRVFAHIEDRTAQRAALIPDADVQEGSMALRRLIANMCNLPGLGLLARMILGNLMMLELIAEKRGNPIA